eukprot:MONOS_1409.1-p1 / transcript=MONOS_1409.1 / gene=MONOS_1409 / organism=Monocercomonoides_exilis_PA203 / gene_product=unspecified product / transcript_product=unspecified product / location=Mono_scaffold00024:201999-204378(-) / protein_length=749 / sequence_SO=supercontig / SO=protein_coding / is_pseudo=false
MGYDQFLMMNAELSFDLRFRRQIPHAPPLIMEPIENPMPYQKPIMEILDEIQKTEGENQIQAIQKLHKFIQTLSQEEVKVAVTPHFIKTLVSTLPQEPFPCIDFISLQVLEKILQRTSLSTVEFGFNEIRTSIRRSKANLVFEHLITDQKCPLPTRKRCAKIICHMNKFREISLPLSHSIASLFLECLSEYPETDQNTTECIDILCALGVICEGSAEAVIELMQRVIETKADLNPSNKIAVLCGCIRCLFELVYQPHSPLPNAIVGKSMMELLVKALRIVDDSEEESELSPAVKKENTSKEERSNQVCNRSDSHLPSSSILTSSSDVDKEQIKNNKATHSVPDGTSSFLPASQLFQKLYQPKRSHLCEWILRFIRRLLYWSQESCISFAQTPEILHFVYYAACVHSSDCSDSDANSSKKCSDCEEITQSISTIPSASSASASASVSSSSSSSSSSFDNSSSSTCTSFSLANLPFPPLAFHPSSIRFHAVRCLQTILFIHTPRNPNPHISEELAFLMMEHPAFLPFLRAATDGREGIARILVGLLQVVHSFFDIVLIRTHLKRPVRRAQEQSCCEKECEGSWLCCEDDGEERHAEANKKKEEEKAKEKEEKEESKERENETSDCECACEFDFDSTKQESETKHSQKNEAELSSMRPVALLAVSDIRARSLLQHMCAVCEEVDFESVLTSLLTHPTREIPVAAAECLNQLHLWKGVKSETEAPSGAEMVNVTLNWKVSEENCANSEEKAQ